MKFRVRKNIVGILVISAAAIWSLTTVLRREVERVADRGMNIRFAYPVLDPGFRAAMKTLCAQYEKIQAAKGRKVTVTPIEIPLNVYPQWARTQLIGKTAPEIMVITYELNRDPVLIARYFRSLGDDIELPNPYDAGTPHAGVPWRDTFVDGMRISGYIFTLADHYGIPISVNTQRMVANRKLLKEILSDPSNAALAKELGPSMIPRTYEQFIALCDTVKPWSKKTGTSLVPIAANKDSGRVLLDYSIGSQDQQLLLDWPVLKDARNGATTVVTRLQEGKPIWTNPAFKQGLELFRQIGLRTQQGFMQLRPDDSNFTFATGGALMTYVSSQDLSSLKSMVSGNIDLVTFRLPYPTKGDPHFGKYSWGPLSEAYMGGANPFGIVNFSSEKKQEQALDFLQFLSSDGANRTFTKISGLVPVIAGVKAGAQVKPFALHRDGYPIGPPLRLGINDLRSLIGTYLYLLTSPQGSVGKFLKIAPGPIRDRAIQAIKLGDIGTINTSARHDPQLASYYWLQTYAPKSAPDADQKLSTLIDANDGNECDGVMRIARLKWYLDHNK